MLRSLLAALLLAAPSAWAQDDPLDALPEAEMPSSGETRTAPRPKPAPTPDADADADPESEPDSEADDGFEDILAAPEEPVDESGEFDVVPTEDEFFDDTDEDEAADTVRAPREAGEDSADIYRRTVNALMEAEAEERLATWEQYLADYPNTAFLEQISKDIAEAESELYGGGIQREVEGLTDKRVIPFPEMVLGENLNPATRIRVGFEWGIPEWINLIGDGEYAINPSLSGHFALRKRFTGWAIELGPRVAILKVPDLGLIVSAVGDLHIGVNPAIMGLRPTLMAGIVPIDDLYLQAQGSPEWELINGAWSVRYRAGGNVTYRAAEPIALFVEGDLEAKYLGWPGGAFQFHQVVFGMRFYPASKTEKRTDSADVLVGGTVPMMFNYWDFHKGAATVQAAAYLE